MHFDLKYDLASPDTLWTGAITDDPNLWDMLPTTGSSKGSFEDDGGLDRGPGGSRRRVPLLRALLRLRQQGDGATVDNLRVLCRDQTYADSIVPPNDARMGGRQLHEDRRHLDGHAARVGRAALVRAAAPSAEPRPGGQARSSRAAGSARLCRGARAAASRSTPSGRRRGRAIGKRRRPPSSERTDCHSSVHSRSGGRRASGSPPVPPAASEWTTRRSRSNQGDPRVRGTLTLHAGPAEGGSEGVLQDLSPRPAGAAPER